MQADVSTDVVGTINTNYVWTTYTPILKGASDDPSPVTYSVQVGKYMKINKLCWFKVILTTTSITKSTLTDNLRVSLPFTAATQTGDETLVSARVENGTPVVNGTSGRILSNTAYCEFISLPVGAASAVVTYALLSLGVLTNTISFRASGFFETA